MIDSIPTTEQEMLAACESALRLAPADYPPGPPPIEKAAGVPDWYSFEHEAWRLGESIRQGFVQNPGLKKNGAVLRKVLEVATCRNLRRGRQSFIMALGFLAAQQHGATLAPLLRDQDVAGQVIYTLVKMKAPGFVRDIEPFIHSETTWIRNLAKKYLSRYGVSAR